MAKKLLHILVVFTIIGELFWAGMLFWAGENVWAFASVGVFFVYAGLYWIYGIDYFKVDWLLDIKYGRKSSNDSKV